MINLDVDDIVRDALEPLGGEWTSASEAKSARRLLNMILIKLQNKNIPLSKLSFETLTLVNGTKTYTLTDPINNILAVTYKEQSSSTERQLSRYGIKDYHNIPNKDQKGTPNLYFIDRKNNTSILYLWPVPSEKEEGDTLELLTSNRIDEILGAAQKIDIDNIYLPLLVDWLSYELSLRRPNVDPNLRVELMQKYRETMQDVFDEDRERVDFKITPNLC